MPTPTAAKMCLDGRIVDYADCRVHAFSGAVKYGAGVFEGIRAYWNDKARELYVFRLREHVERLRFGMRVARLEPVYETAFLEKCVLDTLRANDIRGDVHIRMIAFLSGDDELAATSPVGLVVGCVPRSTSKNVRDGITTCISSITRIADNALPPRVKATANYMNNRAAEIEAQRNGYGGALMLTANGKVSEGTGACLFIVRDGKLITPDTGNDILESVTRDTILRLGREKLGLEVVERPVDRTELYAADEAFLCGSGWEVVPVREVDRIALGDGKVGSLTRRVQDAYFALVRGDVPDNASWRTAAWQAS